MQLKKISPSAPLLIILNDYRINSINKITLQTIHGIPDQKFYVCAIEEVGPLLPSFKQNAHVTTLGAKNNLLKKIFLIYQSIKNNGIFAIQTHNLKSECIAFLYKLFFPSLQIISNRHNYLFSPKNLKNSIKNFCYSHFVHWCTMNVCVAKHLTISLHKELRVNSNKLYLIPNGTSPNRLSHTKPNSPKKIVFFGQFIPRKSLQTLLLALKKLNQQHLTYLIGNGEQERQLRQLATHLPVVFIPFQKYPHQFLQSQDIFVLPSTEEGLSLSLMEAMQLGLCCIVSDNPGNKEIIKDQINGYLFPVGDATQLAQKINWVFDHPAVCARIGQQAKKTITLHYSAQKMINQYRQLYRNLQK